MNSRLSGVALLFGAWAATAFSQVAPDPVTKLAQITISEVPVEKQILPTIRPISSVLGDERSIIDTPRSVSSVNKAWMEERGVRDAMDFGQFSPGVYSAAQYGIPATPQIRGDLGELYVNGQQAKYSRNSVFPSFNGVEALDIVKGPGGAVYGPQGQGPGGYVNLVTKRPFFDKARTQVQATLGYWVPGGQSYGNPELQIDTGGPLSNRLAYRVSYLGRFGDGYYRNQKNETQDFYAAVSFRPRAGLSLEWFGQFYASRFNEVPGVNRVTQSYIDHQTYASGSVLPLNAFGSPVSTSPSFLLLDPATYRPVKLYPFSTLSGPRDSARAKRFTTQLIATESPGNDVALRNLTYFETRTTRKLEVYGYDEYVPTDWTVDNRTEYHAPVTVTGIEDRITAGLDVKYSRLVSYQDFSSEPFFLYDISQPSSSPQFPPYATTGTFGGLPIPGKPGYSGNAFADSGNQDSRIFDSGIFFQNDLSLSSALSAIAGVRLESIHASAASSALVGKPRGSFYNVSGHVADPAWFASLLYKLSDTSSVYVTYNRINAITGTINFGGINGASNSSAGLKNSMRGLGELLEAGYKESVLHNTLYTSLAVFSQTRQRPQLVGPDVEIRTHGIEFETVYQPNPRFSLNANATYQDATQYGRTFFEQSGTYRDGYPATLTIDGLPGTGRGSPNFTRYAPPGGRMRATSVPSFLANAFAVYQASSGFGGGVGPQVWGRQYQNDEGTLIIPAQFELDGYLFYRRPSWDVQLNVKNITDERNYTPTDPTFAGNDVIYANPPLTASLTFRLRF